MMPAFLVAVTLEASASKLPDCEKVLPAEIQQVAEGLSEEQSAGGDRPVVVIHKRKVRGPDGNMIEVACRQEISKVAPK